MRYRFLAAFAAIAVGACATPVTHQTASGKVEVTVTGAQEPVKAELVNVMVNRGYTINRDSPFQIVFEKPIMNGLAAALLGSRYNSTPDARVSFTITQNGQATRIVGDLAVITNPGSGFEMRTDFNNSQDSAQIQLMLDGIRDHFPTQIASPAP
jgi:hypothetical protein